MRHNKSILVLCFIILQVYACNAFALPVKREIIAIHNDFEPEYGARFSKVHRILEMPLNHLGLMVKHYSVKKRLPDLSATTRGIILWLQGSKYVDPAELLHWLNQALDLKIKILLIGDLSIDPNPGTLLEKALFKFYQRIGLLYSNQWQRYTYLIEFNFRDPFMSGFERKIMGDLPSYYQIKKASARTHVFLSTKSTQQDKEFVLMSAHPNGGFIADGYVFYIDKEEKRKQYYINPFEFFQHVFATTNDPIPDTTTLTGQRLFYSHIDGDGWNNVTEIKSHAGKQTLSSAIVYEHIIKKYSHSPVTVAPIAGDLDKQWYGTDASAEVAREIFKLPNVEAATHTYSHPYKWSFFKSGDYKKEIPYLTEYKKSWQPDASMASFKSTNKVKKLKKYDAPRAYAVEQYNLEKEIMGSIHLISQFLPTNKKLKLVQWSGDTSPYHEVLKLTRKHQLRNINGGDTRFDSEYQSLTWVAPIGYINDDMIQIYASNSNENTYTDLWTGRFFGFQYLKQTIKNTEIPLRLKPFNIYYHMYSGQKLSSLKAVQRNLDYADTLNLTPVSTREYAAICDGFFSTTIDKINTNRWEIRNRDHMQTIRFDHAIFKAVNMAQSKGVIGQRHFHGSLYVALDPLVKSPVIQIHIFNQPFQYPDSEQAYLLYSRWPVSDYQFKQNKINFSTSGYGKGKMSWIVGQQGTYQVTAMIANNEIYKQDIAADSNKRLIFELPDVDVKQVRVSIMLK